MINLIFLLLLVFCCTCPEPKYLRVCDYTHQIVRDTYGVPHIYANIPEGAFFAEGYVEAEDRLWQMEILRRAAKGELAEIFGKKKLNADRDAFIRGYSREELLLMYEKFSPPVKRYIKAYVEGVNSYIKKGKLPSEFTFKPRLWDVTDPIAIAIMHARHFGGSGDVELMFAGYYNTIKKLRGKDFADDIFHDFLRIVDPRTPTTLHDHAKKLSFNKGKIQSDREIYVDLDKFLKLKNVAIPELSSLGIPVKFGSNTWVVSPLKSKSGNAILYGGPMMGFSTPSICNEIHLCAKGLNCAGMSFPGIPGVLIGFNENIAWTTTSGDSDMVDIFELRLNPDNPEQYFYKGKWVDLQKRTRVVKVKDKKIKLSGYRSIYGPVISISKKRHVAYSICYPFWKQEYKTMEAFILFGFSKGLEDFVKQVKKITTSHNIFYADTKGNIGFWYAGRHPIRHKNHDRCFPAKGDGNMDWTGFYKFEQIPQKINPKHGFFANWNNKPSKDWQACFFGRIFWGKKIIDALEAKQKLSFNDVWNISKEVAYHNYLADYFKQYLINAIKKSKDPQIGKIAKMLEQWDNTNLEGSLPAEIFNQWIDTLIVDVFQDEIGLIPKDLKILFVNVLLYNLEGKKSPIKLRRDYFNNQDRDKVIIKSLKKVLKKLKSKKQKGYRVSQINFGKGIGIVKSPRGRGTYMLIIELSKKPKAFSCLPPGQSANKNSPHYSNQIEIFKNWKYKSLDLFYPKSINQK